MDFSLSSSLVGNAVLKPSDGLALNLQFAADKTLTARKGPTPAFTRVQSTSTGSSFVGSDGLIQYAAANQPRFDHDPLTLDCKGLLIEEQRTNVILQSENFVSASWPIINATVSADSTTSPDGSTTADKLIAANSAIGRIQQSFVLTGAYNMSIFAKAGEWGWILLSPLGANTGCWFNLSNGTVGTQVSGYVGSITPFGNGWYRCSVSFTGVGTAGTTARIIPTNANNATTNGNGTSGIYLWGAQLEAGASPTSYIPTTTTSVIRSADVCSILSAASVINNLQGTLEVNFSTNTGIYPTFSSPLTIRDSTGANGVSIEVVQASATTFNQRFRNYVGGSGLLTNMTGTLPILTTCKIAVGYEPSNSVGAKNSVLTATNTSTLAFTLPVTQVLIGSPIATTSPLNGCVSVIKIYRKRLPDAKLQTITA